MPSLPSRRLAGAAERWFAHPATVDAVEPLSPTLVRVGFDAPHVRGTSWRRGQEIEFRVSDRDFRHYTPASLDPDRGRVEVVFALTADGPGRRWTERLDVGTSVAMMGPGPGGGVKRWTPSAPGRSLFLGDASAIGLFQALLPGETDAVGAVEVPADDLDAVDGLVPQLTAVAADGPPGRALRRWLAGSTGPVGRACLAGHAGTIQELRSDLRARGAVTTATKAHWATGRAGL